MRAEPPVRKTARTNGEMRCTEPITHRECSMIGSIHIVPRGETWGVLREGDDSEILSFMSEADALAVGRDIAKEDCAELVIHDADGGIKGLDFYGLDTTSREARGYSNV